MKKKVVVISLGGSQIIPDKVGYSYLNSFKKVILKHKNEYNFVIVCGGGSLARKYISAIEREDGSEYFQSLSGISATRANARFVSYFFGMDAKRGIPKTKRTVRKYLNQQGIVFCGALEYVPEQTSDSVGAELAEYFKGEFINLTNVNGLYTSDPKKNKNAKLVSQINWENFNTIAEKTKYSPGQHFVLDQRASELILKHKISTYIIGKISEFDKFLNKKKFIGTIIKG